MPPPEVEAVIKKYNWPGIAIATWRDPKLSVHPARGGSTSPTISPGVAMKPFVPTYKIKYPPLPEATDDEGDDGKNDKSETKAPEGKY